VNVTKSKKEKKNGDRQSDLAGRIRSIRIWQLDGLC